MMSYKSVLISIILFSTILSCKKEFQNPTPTLPVDAQTPEGMIQLVNGIKNRFAVNSIYGNGAVFNGITANGFSSNEITITAGGNQDFGQLVSGKNNIATNNAVLTELWSNCMLINSISSLLLVNVDEVVKDQNWHTSIKQYAYLYKAMAIGTLANYWEAMPIETGPKAVFVYRTEALKKALLLLDSAQQLPDAPIMLFGDDIQLKATIFALKARYYMMILDNSNAITNASQASLARKSYFVYDPQNPNPVFRYGFNANFGYKPKPNFGLPTSLSPDPADKRINTYLTGDAKNGFGFGKGDLSILPIYLPGEMLLIQAEGYVRKGDLVNGKKFLDLVLTKPADIFGVVAGLPPYSGSVDSASLMKEIYKNRCIELFMNGMKLEDSRRFARPGPTDVNSERTRNFYPYPMQERNDNTNTPADPDI